MSARDIYAVKRGLGLRKTLAGLDYTRSVEYPVALELLEPASATRILEIGSSKLPLAQYLLASTDAEVVATDLDPVVMWQRDYARKLGFDERLSVAVEDARRLSFPDGRFDRVIAVSTLEHVEAVERAAAEIGRVLAPGGIAVVSVPFSRVSRRVTLDSPSYAGTVDQDPAFFQLVFDEATLRTRVIEPSGVTVERIVYLGEPGMKLSKLVYHHVAGRLMKALAWQWPWTASLFYRQIDLEQVTSGSENVAIVKFRRAA